MQFQIDMHICITHARTLIYIHTHISKVGDCRQWQTEDSLFNSYYAEVWERALLLSLDCSTLPLIRNL